MTTALAPVETPLAELRVWLAAAEEMLDRQMEATDPRYVVALLTWNERHEVYMARVLAEGEPE